MRTSQPGSVSRKQRKPRAGTNATSAKGGTSRTAKKPAAKPKKPARRPSKTPAPTSGPGRVGPLEATYSGVVFRSRAEARWAVFFDLMGWSWDYEPCHYSLGSLRYLPDFYLPDLDAWVEVKGPTFLDAVAMGKVASAAAGPHPLPSRRPPYGPASAVVLVGPITAARPGRPVHQVATATSKAHVAGLHRAVWEVDGTVRALDATPWLTVPATGDKTSRRPTAARTTQILAPSPIDVVGMHPSLVRAYDVAATVRFDDAGRLARSTPPGLQAELALRRAGRPLGCAA